MTITVKAKRFVLLHLSQIFMILMQMRETNILKDYKILPRKTEIIHLYSSGYKQEIN